MVTQPWKAANERHKRTDANGAMEACVCDEKIEYLADLALGRWNSVSCPGLPMRCSEHVAAVGLRLFYFSGGQVNILLLSPALSAAGRAS